MILVKNLKLMAHLGRMEGLVDFETTQWFWTRDPWSAILKNLAKVIGHVCWSLWLNYERSLSQAGFFLKHLQVSTSVPFRLVWDCIIVLEELSIFLRVNFRSCSCIAVLQQLFGLLNKYRFLTCSWSELFYEIAFPKKKSEHISETICGGVSFL